MTCSLNSTLQQQEKKEGEKENNPCRAPVQSDAEPHVCQAALQVISPVWWRGISWGSSALILREPTQGTGHAAGQHHVQVQEGQGDHR